eukprot:GHVQ01011906.1.p1 GENE.GHVQ01011906.1~~GHVQ01011906.1.p1  ORF type:complete len:647 (+),score=130.07 GHVQ01011906.1:754-2694(+)
MQPLLSPHIAAATSFLSHFKLPDPSSSPSPPSHPRVLCRDLPPASSIYKLIAHGCLRKVGGDSLLLGGGSDVGRRIWMYQKIRPTLFAGKGWMGGCSDMILRGEEYYSSVRSRREGNEDMRRDEILYRRRESSGERNCTQTEKVCTAVCSVGSVDSVVTVSMTPHHIAQRFINALSSFLSIHPTFLRYTHAQPTFALCEAAVTPLHTHTSSTCASFPHTSHNSNYDQDAGETVRECLSEVLDTSMASFTAEGLSAAAESPPTDEDMTESVGERSASGPVSHHQTNQSGSGGGSPSQHHGSGGVDSHHHPMWRSEQNQPFERKMEDALIFCGNSNRPLGDAVADRLGTKLGRVSVKRFADGEVSMQFLDSLRGKDVYIIQPTGPPVNEHLMELLLMISTCRRSSAKKITAVIPYYGYARQDRKLSSRVPISAADVACMIEAMGVDRVVAVDLHCGQIQGFFGPRVPVDNLEAQLIGLDYFTEQITLEQPVVVSPDAGGVYRARKFQEGLIARGHEDSGIAMLIKQRARANEIERMDLVGTVEGSDVVIVDDMIDTAGTLCEAAKVLKNHGARRVFAFATHGLFSGPAVKRIQDSPLEKVVVTDTLMEKEDKCSKIERISVSVLLADTIRRIHQKESLYDLFDVKNNN